MPNRYHDFTTTDFIRESNEIEGILRDPFEHEVAGLDALRRFIRPPTVMEVTALAKTFCLTAELRNREGMNVMVGAHIPPLGGPGVERMLDKLLLSAMSPFDLYCAFEWLHPFIDGNGRTGRALWLWRMGGHPQSFLRAFHYQSLDNADKELDAAYKGTDEAEDDLD